MSLRHLGRNLFRRRRVEAELDAELRDWLDAVVEEKMAHGVPRAEAERLARVELGGLETVKEEVRAVRAGVFVLSVIQDVRYATRLLRKQPGFAAAVVITLALGIGVNTAIFGVVDAVMLKPLPGVRAPDELVWLRGSSSQTAFLEYRATTGEVFTGMTALGGRSSHSLASVSLEGTGEIVTGERVSPDFFGVLGVEMALGRPFFADDGGPGAAPVAVVSDHLWRTRLHADPELIGKPVLLNGESTVIVGVAPRGFVGPEVGMVRDVWLPLPRDVSAAEDSARLNVIARLRPDVSRARAQAVLGAVAARIETKPPDRDDRQERIAAAALLPVVGGLDPRDRVGAGLVAAVLMVLVGLVLLIACSNVAGLLLARATSRVKEMGIRRALGAGRARLVRQLLIESLLLALLGGGAGLGLAALGGAFVERLARATPIAPPNLGLDPPVLAFAAALTIVTAVLFGLAPALQASRADVLVALKQDGPALGTGLRRSRLRNGLVVVQVAISLFLLVGAGLFARSLAHARDLDPGFTVANGLLLAVHPEAIGLSEADGQELYRRVVATAETVPGVERASLLHEVPLGFSSSLGSVTPLDRGPASDAAPLRAGFDVVGPAYFAAMGIPIVRGRDLGPGDIGGVAVVNETLARRLVPGGDAVGKTIRFGGPSAPALSIVGVARDSRTRTLGEAGRGFIYLPLGHNYRGSMTLVVRTRSEPSALAPRVEAALHDAEPRLPHAEPSTLAAQVDFALLPARAAAVLLGGFGLLSLVLASVGVYGLVAFSVKQRVREIGIRVALGATRGSVLGLVLGEGIAVVGLGVVIGLALALVSTRVAGSFLYGLSPDDPATFVGISASFLAVAALASYLPARRALAVDPMVALRGE